MEKYISAADYAITSIQRGKCWYVPCTEKNYELLAQALKGKAILEADELKKYLLEKKKNKPLPALPYQNKPVAKQETKKTPAPVQPLHYKVSTPAKEGTKKTFMQQAKYTNALSKENIEALQKFKQQLILQRYSESTMRTYTQELMQLLTIIKDTPASSLSVSRLKDYLQYCHETLKLSEATLHSRINAFTPLD